MCERQPEAPAIPGVTRWRKKPIVVTAIQFTGGNVSEIWDAFGADGIYGPTEKNPDHLILTTIHGDPAPARAGDWVIPDGKPGTFYPCKPDVFAATYEPAQPETLVMPADEFEALKSVARTFGAVAAKPCGCGPDEPCGVHAETGTGEAPDALGDLKAELGEARSEGEMIRDHAGRYLRAVYGPDVVYRAPETFGNLLERWIWAVSAGVPEIAHASIADIERHCAERDEADHA